MEIQATQLHQQIKQTRTAMTAKLDLLKQYVSQKVPATVEQTVIAPVRSLPKTTTKGTTLLYQYPWLIIAGGVLFGYYLKGAQTRPISSVQSASQQAMGASPIVPLAVARAMPQVYDSPRQSSTQKVAPPMSVEPTKAILPESRPSAWNLGGLGAKEVARRVMHEIQDDDCLGRAAQLAYYFLFALFPLFLFLTTLLGYLPIPNLLDRIMEVLAQLLTGDALRLVQEHLHQLVTGERGGLLSFGLLAALWTSSSALTAIIDSLNRAYDVDEGRPFWKVRLLAIGLTVGLSVFMVVALMLLTFGPPLGRWVADLVSLGEVFAWSWNLVRWPVIVGLLIIVMALLYYGAPTWSRSGSGLRWAQLTDGKRSSRQSVSRLLSLRGLAR